MAIKRTFGEKLAMLAKAQNKTQTEIANRIGLTPAQVNRLFNGHADMSSQNLLLILNDLGLNMDELVSSRTRKHAEIEESKVETVYDCLNYMFKSIDDLGRQTYLKQLAWVTQATTRKPLPKNVQDILTKETNLI